MEGVYHVDILQISSSSLISHVDRVLQGQVPNGEGFKFGITSLDTPLVFVVELGQAGSHFAAARSGSGHHHQRTGGFHIIILAIAFIADNMLHIMRIALDGIMEVNLDIQSF